MKPTTDELIEALKDVKYRFHKVYLRREIEHQLQGRLDVLEEVKKDYWDDDCDCNSCTEYLEEMKKIKGALK